MLKLFIFVGIMLAIFIIAIGYIFRHELQTLAHKYGMYDKNKALKHEIKRKEITLDAHIKQHGHTLESQMLTEEIKELEKLTTEMEQKK